MRTAFFILPFAIASPAIAERPGIYLLSVENISLGPKEYVEAFSVDAWGVKILATCRIPPGWTITAGSSADPTGVISGQASLGVTFLDRPRLKYLRQIVLVRTDEAVRRHKSADGLPVTFSGAAEIGTYGVVPKGRKQALTYRNISLVPATRCPAPLQ